MKRFLAALQAGAILLAMAMVNTGHAAEARIEQSTMTGAFYMRDTLIPRSDDLALIQRKPALYLASFNDGMATVAYWVDNGRIAYRVVQGQIDESVRADIDRALVRLNRKVA